MGVLTILLMLPISVVGAALVLLDLNDYKSALIMAVQDATGRTLSLNGPLRFSRSLWPTIEASDVALANLPGGTRPDMARAERIEGQLSLPALLWRRIEVIKLTLVGPNILFEQVDGKPNWVFSPLAQANGAPAAPGPASHSFQLRIRNAYVRNGMVTWRLPARTKVVGVRSLDLRHQTDDGPLTMQATLVYSDNHPFGLDVSAQPEPGVAGSWAAQLRFAAFDTTASAKGTVSVAGSYDLQVDAAAGALDKLNALLPEMRLPAVHQATLSTHITNGRVPGDLPVIGTTRLHFEDADLGNRVAGLRLGAADVSLPAAGGLATVAGTGRFAGQRFTVAGTLGVPIHPDDRVSVPMNLKAQAASSEGKDVRGSLALEGSLTLDRLRFGGLDAAAALRTPALASLRPLLARQLPALTNVQFDGHVSIPANAGSLGFRDVKLLTHQGDIAGTGKVGLGPAIALEARLRSAKLDMDAMLDAFGVDLTAPAAPASTAGPLIPDAPLPWAVLRGPAVDLAGSVDALTFGGQDWPQVDLALQLKGGRLQDASLKLPLRAGPVELSIKADASARTLPVSLSVHAPGVPLALAARYAGLPSPVSGTMEIEAQLHGAGQSVRDLAASLDGPFSVTAINGQLSNAALIRMTSASLDALGIKVPVQGETKLGCLGLAGLFTGGVGMFRTIALETTYLSLEGIGQVDLARETVAFKLNPLAQVSGAAVSVPVVVEGPFRGIKGRLDATGLEKLGLLIDAWFGGDKQNACANAGLLPSSAGGQ